MSLPPINPDKTAAGIALDPRTLERVIPESRRPDGSTRKQIKIRPGFTPQEDVRRFRGTKQAQMDASSLPKGHIIGWAPPPISSSATSSGVKPLSKSAKKNAKRKEKREERKDDVVRDNWEEDEEEEGGAGGSVTSSGKGGSVNGGGSEVKTTTARTTGPGKTDHTPDQPNWAAAPEPNPTMMERAASTTTTESDPAPPATTSNDAADGLASKLEKLDVQ